MNLKPILYAVAFILLMAGASLLFRSCKQEKESETIVTQPVKAIRTEKRETLNLDSLNSATEARIRHVADSIANLKDKRYAALMKNYQTLEAQSKKAKTSYHANPTLPKCDSLVNLQGQQIDSLQLANNLQRGIIEQDSVKLASNARELDGKNVAIGALSGTIDQAVKELEKNEKKIARKNTWLKISGGINVVLGIIVAAK